MHPDFPHDELRAKKLRWIFRLGRYKCPILQFTSQLTVSDSIFFLYAKLVFERMMLQKTFRFSILHLVKCNVQESFVFFCLVFFSLSPFFSLFFSFCFFAKMYSKRVSFKRSLINLISDADLRTLLQTRAFSKRTRTLNRFKHPTKLISEIEWKLFFHERKFKGNVQQVKRSPVLFWSCKCAKMLLLAKVHNKFISH